MIMALYIVYYFNFIIINPIGYSGAANCAKKPAHFDCIQVFNTVHVSPDSLVYVEH